MSEPSSEARRLESLWAGQFGDAYSVRNAEAGATRHRFWQDTLAEFPIERVLEVGCNVGANLRWIADALEPSNVFGVDINPTALEGIRTRMPGVNSVWAKARELPFRDRWFDLVFTVGVLIHQPPDALPLVMAEIVRCSRRYVLCGEYYAENLVEVPYRGEQGALFKRDYGRLYLELFPELTLRKQGFLGKDEGFDDVTYWLFEKAW